MLKGRLIIDESADGRRNMAVDEALFNIAHMQNSFPVTLRLYGWNPPCVSIGRRQSFDLVNIDECLRKGLDVVKRIGGGSAVYHENELTYCFVTRLDAMPEPNGVEWRAIFGSLLENFGISPDTPDDRGLARVETCFASSGDDEPTVNGRKWVGSARRRSRSVFLQHGSILLARQPDFFDQLVHTKVEDNSTGLWEVLPDISAKKIASVLTEKIGEAFGVEFQASPASAVETDEADKILHRASTAAI